MPIGCLLQLMTFTHTYIYMYCVQKQEAARKALQDALKGVNNNKDILASFDGKPPAGGAGGGGGGINIKKVVGDFGDEFRKKTIGFFKASPAVVEY